MKKTVYIVICTIGLMAFSSCRSSYKSCGLSDTTKPTTTLLEQLHVT